MDINSAGDKERLIEMIKSPYFGKQIDSDRIVYAGDSLVRDLEKLMNHPAYDADVEQAVIAALGKLPPAAVKSALLWKGNGKSPPFKFTQEMTQTPWKFGDPVDPPTRNPLNTKKPTVANMLFGGLLGY